MYNDKYIKYKTKYLKASRSGHIPSSMSTPS